MPSTPTTASSTSSPSEDHPGLRLVTRSLPTGRPPRSPRPGTASRCPAQRLTHHGSAMPGGPATQPRTPGRHLQPIAQEDAPVPDRHQLPGTAGQHLPGAAPPVTSRHRGHDTCSAAAPAESRTRPPSQIAPKIPRHLPTKITDSRRVIRGNGSLSPVTRRLVLRPRVELHSSRRVLWFSIERWGAGLALIGPAASMLAVSGLPCGQSRKVVENAGRSHASTGYEASCGEQADRLGNCHLDICPCSARSTRGSRPGRGEGRL
jgi:hypothetical protein